MRRLTIATLGLALSACAVGPDYRPPAPLPPTANELREVPGNAGASNAELPSKWWRLFNDAALDRLVERALAHNTDVRQASANLQRARGLLAEAGAARLPTTSFSGSATYNRITSSSSTAGAGGTTPPTGTPGTDPGTDPGGGTPGTGATGAGISTGPFETDFYSLGFDASYELDLFGRVSRTIEGARADVAAAGFGLDAARVSVAAETARAYAQACGFAAQAEVARETARLQGRTLELTRRLLDGGRGTRREVDQAAVLVEQANAQVPQFEAERRSALYALATLTGDPPSVIDETARVCTRPPRTAQPIPAGDGAAMLARRPDVRQAERTLGAEVARIGVATAALYPSVTLLGSVTLGAADPGDLFKSQSFGYSVGPLISFNFPFNSAARARIRQQEAAAEGALAAFDGTLLTALRETEQALARLDGAVRREAALQRALAAAEDAARLSQLRFNFGADNFLQLLDSERERATARAAFAEAQAARADAQVSLFKALGGGWEYAPEVERKLPEGVKERDPETNRLVEAAE